MMADLVAEPIQSELQEFNKVSDLNWAWCQEIGPN